MYLMTNAKYFESHQIPAIRERLSELDEAQWIRVQSLQFKDPTVSLVVSLVGGSLGIDRFLIGDVGLGIGKLITCGGFGVWTIIDFFLIMGATREKNMLQLNSALY